MVLHFRRSLAGRVTMLATMAVGLSVAIVALAGFITVRMQMYSSLDQSLEARASAAARTEGLFLITSRRTPPWLFGAADVLIYFVDCRSSPWSPRGSCDVISAGPTKGLRVQRPELQVALGERRSAIRTVATKHGRYRVVAVKTTQPGLALVLAQSLGPTEETLERLGLVLAMFGGLGVLGAGLAGWAVARSGLRPVRRLTEAAEEIARTEQLDPIRVENGNNDEITRLASAFNAMLAALSASRDRQRQLVADAGHELRTPLTSLRTNLDLLVQADGAHGLSDQLRAELLADVRFQIAELTTLIGDLVELARDEPLGLTLEPVDLADIVDRAVERVRRRAPGLEFDVRSSSWWVEGDSAALERAVTNLLDNAAKWSPPLGTVTVDLEGGTLLVGDEGEGIADEDLPHVFDRFYRSRESRGMPGSGLGLAIVRQVAERHGGHVRAGASPAGGAAFWFTIPGSPETTEPAPSLRRPAADSEASPVVPPAARR